MSTQLTKKDLAQRWGISVRSVERRRAAYGLKPCGFFGRNPKFDLGTVEKMERALAKDRALLGERLAAGQFGYGDVVTVKQAKRLAGKRGAK